MGLKGNIEVIGGLLQERRETEEEERLLQEEIDRVRGQREAAAADSSAQNTQVLQSLDLQIEELTRERADRIRRRENLCRTARTVTAGD